MDSQSFVYLGIQVKPGPIERYKIENFALENSVNCLKNEAEHKANLPAAVLELIYHGKILKDDVTLQSSGVKVGEIVHVVRKKSLPKPSPIPAHTDAELQQLNTSLRTLGCTPNAPGWTRAMQVGRVNFREEKIELNVEIPSRSSLKLFKLLNDDSAMAEIMEHAPSLADECVTLSILHEVELLAALGANIHTMRRGANAHPDLPVALRHLTRLVRLRSGSASNNDSAPISGFAYSLEALSEDEDAEEDENDEGERNPITQEQLAAALQAATEAVSTSNRSHDNLLRLLRESRSAANPSTPTASGTSVQAGITPEMFSAAITDAISRSGTAPATPMEYSIEASSSQSPGAREEDFSSQLHHMHEMGLLDDALNIRALTICSGDVNAAINLVFSGDIAD